MVELDLNGREVARHELVLPEKEAVSCLRRTDNSPFARWAVFSVQGQRIYLFDTDWAPAATVPDLNFKHAGIRDVQFVDADADGRDELVVAFAGDRGIFSYNLKAATIDPISPANAVSLGKVDNRLAYCDQLEIGIFGSARQTLKATSELNFLRLSPMGGDTSDVGGEAYAIARDSNQNWFAIAIGSEWSTCLATTNWVAAFRESNRTSGC